MLAEWAIDNAVGAYSPVLLHVAVQYVALAACSGFGAGDAAEKTLVVDVLAEVSDGDLLLASNMWTVYLAHVTS